MTDHAPGPEHELSAGQLVSQLSEQSSRLVREELQLARLEMKDALKHAGLGAGMFSAAGLTGLFGLGTLIATAVIALDLVLPLWASALIVTTLLFVVAGVMALMGKREVEQVSPTPQRTMENVRRDVQEVKEASKR